MEPKENTDIHSQPENSPTIDQNSEGEENTDAENEPQNSPDVIDEEELVVKLAQAENVDESIVTIPQMEAICEICYNFLQEDASAPLLKTKCKCKFSLVHRQCYDLQNPEKKKAKCDVCGRVIQYIPVTLSRPEGKSTEVPSPSSPKRGGSRLLKKVFG